MIEMLLTLLVMAVVIYVIYLVLGMIQLPDQVKTIVYLIVGLVLLVWFLDFSGILHLDLNSHRTLIAR